MQKTGNKHLSERRLSRRQLLQRSLSGLALAGLSGLPGISIAQEVQVRSLGSGITLLASGGVNQVAFQDNTGLVLVDSGPAESANALMTALAQLNQGPVHTLFNTHWHAQQVGGNALLKDQGASIIAHDKTLQHLSTRYYLHHENRYHEPLGQASWPTTVFHDQGTLESRDEKIDYGWLVQPHTDGDIFVHFHDANVLVAGDAVSPLHDPELDWYGGGWLGGRVNSLDHLLAIANDDTQIIPAAGPVMSRADLQAERDMMQEVYNRVLDLIRQGCSAECMNQEGALDGLSRTWNDPDKFLYSAYKGMWAHHYNLAPNIL